MSRARAAGAFVAVLLLALPATGVVPRADRIARAAAEANRTSGRDQALQLDLTLRVADREPIGTGKLVTHPTGLARLELRDAAGRTERHLLLGTEHSASRGGSELDEPRAFLPPLFLLQVDSPATFEQALADYGLDLSAAALAPCGTRICYVLGDPARVPPPLPGEESGEEDEDGEEIAAVFGQEEEEDTPDFFFDETMRDPVPPPTLWVDSRTFEIVRIESRSGVAVEFGPTADYGGVRFPDAITIHEPEREPVRFDILGVTAVNAPAAGFTRVWLLTPAGDAQEASPKAPASPMGQ